VLTKRADGRRSLPADHPDRDGVGGGIYEGALLFATDNSCNYGYSRYKGDLRGTMTEGPRLRRREPDEAAPADRVAVETVRARRGAVKHP
jgi:hypothetical protein